MRISHRLYVMGHGRIVFEGTPAELNGQRRDPQGMAGGLAYAECTPIAGTGLPADGRSWARLGRGRCRRDRRELGVNSAGTTSTGAATNFVLNGGPEGGPRGARAAPMPRSTRLPRSRRRAAMRWPAPPPLRRRERARASDTNRPTREPLLLPPGRGERAAHAPHRAPRRGWFCRIPAEARGIACSNGCRCVRCGRRTTPLPAALAQMPRSGPAIPARPKSHA